jgi:hypothetical protein
MNGQLDLVESETAQHCVKGVVTDWAMPGSHRREEISPSQKLCTTYYRVRFEIIREKANFNCLSSVLALNPRRPSTVARVDR